MKDKINFSGRAE